MDNFYLTAIVREISPELAGRPFVSASVSGTELRLDLRLSRHRILLVSVDRSWPGLFLSKKPRKKETREPATTADFAAVVNRCLADYKLRSIYKPPNDRLVRLEFEPNNGSLGINRPLLVLDLRGNISNAYLYDDKNALVGLMYGADRPGRPRRKMQHAETPEKAVDKAKQALEASASISPIARKDRHLSASLRAELTARSSTMSSEQALGSLIMDLEETDPEPSVYSRYPIEEAGHRLVDLRTELLLSQINQVHAENMRRYRFDSLSEAAEAYWDAYARSRAFNESFRKLRQALSREISRQTAIVHALEADRRRFENPEALRRAGELLLANIGSARVVGDVATVVDYYDSTQSKTQIELPKGATLQQAAGDYFARYQKANRALAAIEARRKEVEGGLASLTQQLAMLDEEPTEQRVTDVRAAAVKLGLVPPDTTRKWVAISRRSRAPEVPGRRFRSSDGYEIVVGRNDRENDAITFKVARSRDVWLHAADYPGSHVIIRNHSRADVPHRTITEAAEVAALNSKASRAQKVAVHYTLRKFVSKPPRAKPGLVRLSSFKTLMVEPRCKLEKLV